MLFEPLTDVLWMLTRNVYTTFCLNLSCDRVNPFACLDSAASCNETSHGSQITFRHLPSD